MREPLLRSILFFSLMFFFAARIYTLPTRLYIDSIYFVVLWMYLFYPDGTPCISVVSSGCSVQVLNVTWLRLRYSGKFFHSLYISRFLILVYFFVDENPLCGKVSKSVGLSKKLLRPFVVVQSTDTVRAPPSAHVCRTHPDRSFPVAQTS